MTTAADEIRELIEREMRASPRVASLMDPAQDTGKRGPPTL
jgi:hypothetical protein